MYINRYVYSVLDMYRHAEPGPHTDGQTYNLSSADLSGPRGKCASTTFLSK